MFIIKLLERKRRVNYIEAEPRLCYLLWKSNLMV